MVLTGTQSALAAE